MQTISLYGIEESLATLMDALEDIPMDQDLTEEQRAEELAIITATLEDYCRQEVQKVDNVRAYLKHCEAMEAAAKAEEAAMSRRRKLWADRQRRLKDFVIAAMDVAGKKRIEGHTGTLFIKGNGGVEPLVIDNPALIPCECVEARIKMPLAMWDHIIANLPPDTQEDLYGAAQEIKEPSTKLIREALSQDCERCDGNGVVEAGEEPWPTSPESPCIECGGTGKRGVPGCHLEPRGRHLEIK